MGDSEPKWVDSVNYNHEMVPGEEDAVASLWAACTGASLWNARDVRQLAQNGARIWVSREEGQLVGAAAVRVAGDEAELLNLGVLPQWRGRDVGTGLVKTAIWEAGLGGAKSVFLEVRESNVGARAFYHKLGFQQIGRRRAYYRDPVEDALVMSLLVPK